MKNPEGLSTQTVGENLCFWPASSSMPKTRLTLSEDLFFTVHLILDRTTGPILGGKIFIMIFVILKFFEFPGPPFQNPAYATGKYQD